ncbi:hypothetical protein O6H91_13G054400 [Diphasiastrum complanatum]|uniref:Uncharacterized protein n=1 Tax=Diphasiastrum complanatum TaxID=34168 RepID=A0ACC2BVX4_DIPCM|nr:hypothetical protein O6H91_13G054400 [Diphasiastrum complanatum]
MNRVGLSIQSLVRVCVCVCVCVRVLENKYSIPNSTIYMKSFSMKTYRRRLRIQWLCLAESEDPQSTEAGNALRGSEGENVRCDGERGRVAVAHTIQVCPLHDLAFCFCFFFALQGRRTIAQ